MSLLDKASLIVTPNAYKTSKLYSVIPNTALGDMDVVRATTPSTRVNSAGLIETVGLNIPRIDYTNGSCPSLLVEPQRTNLLLRSQEFDNISWFKTNTNLNPNVSIAPDGTLSGDKASLTVGTNPLAADSTGVYQPQVLTSGTYNYSIFAKASERNIIRWRDGGFSGNYLVVNLTNGTFTNGEPTRFINPQVIAYPNGWYRISFTTGVITSNSLYPLRFGDVGQTGDGVSGGFIWGAQLEAASYPTSYIPTVASIQTRNADVISKTGISSLINPSAGTLYVEAAALNNVDIIARYFSLSNANVNDNQVLIQFPPAGSQIRFDVYGGGSINRLILSGMTITNFNKIALSWSSLGSFVYINGVKYTMPIVSGTINAVPAALSRIDFNAFYGGQESRSKIKSAIIFKTTLTDQECIALTTL